ncbi:MAG: hypothetical protein M0P61_17880 [Ignavibacteriaceae bacterium]|nr:hypothetical protein [Ignavibacteriaceae bacterium]
MRYYFFRKIQFFLLVIIPLNVHVAQTLNLQAIPNEKTQIGISFDKPSYGSVVKTSTLSGIYQLFIDVPISSKFNLLSNFPVINISTEYDLGYGGRKYKYEASGAGNIFVGLQTHPPVVENGRSITTFGIFLPTADEKVASSGIFINNYDMQKYWTNSLGLYFNYAYQRTSDYGIGFTLEFGPNFMIPTKGNGATSELFLHYGFDLGYQVDKLMMNVEILGTAFLSEEANNFEDRFNHALSFGAHWKGTTFTPKIFYRVYLRKEMRDMIDGVLGLGITASID